MHPEDFEAETIGVDVKEVFLMEKEDVPAAALRDRGVA